MTLTEEHHQNLVISRYTPGTIDIGENSYHSSLLITPAGKILTWAVQHLDEFTEACCQKIIDYHPEVVIVGTGTHHQLPNLAIIHSFTNHKIGIEMMSTAAACRTYNVLAVEGRNVMAALIIS
jgi:uncharacterized protein